MHDMPKLSADGSLQDGEGHSYPTLLAQQVKRPLRRPRQCLIESQLAYKKAIHVTACAAVPNPTWRSNPDLGTRSSHFFILFYFIILFESFRIIQIQLLSQTHFKYSMKIYIHKYHFNIKGPHHLITKIFFFFHSMWHFMPIWSISHLYTM